MKIEIRPSGEILLTSVAGIVSTEETPEGGLTIHLDDDDEWIDFDEVILTPAAIAAERIAKEVARGRN